MGLLFRSPKKEKLRRIESKLFILVERKESREQVIDDYGRKLVLALRDYQSNQTGSKYRKLMKEAKQYLSKNESYFW